MLNELINKIYETEGLLELMRLREDKQKELLPLVETRFAEAAGLLKKLSSRLSEEKKDDKTEEVVEVASSRPAKEESLIEVAEDLDSDQEVVPEIKPRIHRGNQVFCLNDRFRFSNALFHGDDTTFNAVMDYVVTLSSYDEAEDYFYGERGFDPNDEHVVEFMEIIRNYFAK